LLERAVFFAPFSGYAVVNKDGPSLLDKLAALRTDAGLRTILDGIGEGFYAVDCDWRILLFNSEASRHFRVAADEVLGRVLWDVFPGARETGLGQMFLRTMASRDTIISETESVIFPGRWLAYRLFPLGDGIGVVFRDTTDRRNAEKQRDLVVTELGHRIKNTLALVQSIASQTFSQGAVDPSTRRAFEARLVALSNAQAILTKRSWDSADLHEVLSAAIRPHTVVGRDAFKLDGPMLRLGPKSAVALAMAVHELCTNASKYGALSTNGCVDMLWTIANDRWQWTWRERGGPVVVPPLHKGFGSRMLEQALGAQLAGQATLRYDPDGLRYSIDAPLDFIRQS
jgi:two-component sensor histidine kinase